MANSSGIAAIIHHLGCFVRASAATPTPPRIADTAKLPVAEKHILPACSVCGGSGDGRQHGAGDSSGTAAARPDRLYATMLSSEAPPRLSATGGRAQVVVGPGPAIGRSGRPNHPIPGDRIAVLLPEYFVSPSVERCGTMTGG
jgi:hypothetical protein